MSANRLQLDFAQALDAYLRYAPRLPQVAPDAVPKATDYVDNLLAIADQFDQRFLRMWRYYLAYCECGFDDGRIDVMHVALRRTD